MKIHYYAEIIGPNRAQLHCDVVEDGRLLMSWPIGSPAPVAAVKRRERVVDLG